MSSDGQRPLGRAPACAPPRRHTRACGRACRRRSRSGRWPCPVRPWQALQSWWTCQRARLRAPHSGDELAELSEGTLWRRPSARTTSPACFEWRIEPRRTRVPAAGDGGCGVVPGGVTESCAGGDRHVVDAELGIMNGIVPGMLREVGRLGQAECFGNESRRVALERA